MSVKIAVLKETRANERRVAMVPAVADKLIKLGAQIGMQSGAGDAVKLADAAFPWLPHRDNAELVNLFWIELGGCVAARQLTVHLGSIGPLAQAAGRGAGPKVFT